MRLIETLEGIGTVVSGDESTPVRYEIWIHQDTIHAGNMQDPHATIPGMKTISGVIRPVCGAIGAPLKLMLQDGKKTAVFFFKSSDGTIHVNALLD